ncbi:unnamed protein product [Bursaphelenchus xylophilus]|uniref:(pine wood nematode) hypothetical protein n=1 Tax=Bursaphelenchus xylophilus TaxID=6326 RepID=A0A1I7RMT4_BURXY|nr:unnamed protein product [Bursaphelenchus xylophilus]CAG9125491.1 unnamed protein product [Bursaphelenchus xylophilus]
MVSARDHPEHFSELLNSSSEEWPALNSSLLAGNPRQFGSQYEGFESADRKSPLQRRANGPSRMSAQAPTLAETLRQTYGAQPETMGVQQQQAFMAQQLQQQTNNSAKNPKLYKTELCRSWMESGRCNYGERCQYAHGENEKRPIPRHPKYKTEACQSYHQSGYCPYGPRCHFIHNEEPHVLAQLVAQNAAAAAASKAQQQQTLQQARSQAQLSNASPQRPNSLFALSRTNSVTRTGGNVNAIATAAAMAAAAFSQQPQLFSRQFQNQLQMFSEGSVTPKPAQKQPDALGSTGDSPIPSSNDSGTESPLGSFSPGFEAEDPFYNRKEVKYNPVGCYPQMTQQTHVEWSLAQEFSELSPYGPKSYNRIAPPPGLQQQRPDMAPLNLLPSSLSSDVESGFLSSASSIASNKSTSPLAGSPPTGTTPLASAWSTGTTPTQAGRLPVFERLSNGP